MKTASSRLELLNQTVRKTIPPRTIVRQAINRSSEQESLQSFCIIMSSYTAVLTVLFSALNLCVLSHPLVVEMQPSPCGLSGS